MVSKTGKTEVANNSIGIYGNMDKDTGKNPLLYITCIKHAIQFSTFLDSDPVSTIIFQS